MLETKATSKRYYVYNRHSNVPLSPSFGRASMSPTSINAHYRTSSLGMREVFLEPMSPSNRSNRTSPDREFQRSFDKSPIRLRKPTLQSLQQEMLSQNSSIEERKQRVRATHKKQHAKDRKEAKVLRIQKRHLMATKIQRAFRWYMQKQVKRQFDNAASRIQIVWRQQQQATAHLRKEEENKNRLLKLSRKMLPCAFTGYRVRQAAELQLREAKMKEDMDFFGSMREKMENSCASQIQKRWRNFSLTRPKKKTRQTRGKGKRGYGWSRNANRNQTVKR